MSSNTPFCLLAVTDTEKYSKSKSSSTFSDSQLIFFSISLTPIQLLFQHKTGPSSPNDAVNLCLTLSVSEGGMFF